MTTAPARLASAIRRAAARARHGRPGRLAARAAGTLAAAATVLHSGAGPAPEAGVLAGLATWLALAARADIAPPPPPPAPGRRR